MYNIYYITPIIYILLILYIIYIIHILHLIIPIILTQILSPLSAPSDACFHFLSGGGVDFLLRGSRSAFPAVFLAIAGLFKRGHHALGRDDSSWWGEDPVGRNFLLFSHWRYPAPSHELLLC